MTVAMGRACSERAARGTGLDGVPDDPCRGFRGPAYVSGAEGPERIAPAGDGSQGDSVIPPGSIAVRPRRPARPRGARGRLPRARVVWHSSRARPIIRRTTTRRALSGARRVCVPL